MITDEWTGCYSDGWTGLIVPEAFAHPAKFSRALIQRIYQHVIAEGWAGPGDVVVDPFGGVALGALDAQFAGLSWVGCELEQKFVDLGRQNLDLWQRRYSTWPSWGRAIIIQGDSRNLAAIVQGAGIGMSSPPYIGSVNQSDQANDAGARLQRKAAAGVDISRAVKRGGPNSVLNQPQVYGATDGQLGAMPTGEPPALSVASPPFCGVEGAHSADKFSDPEGSAARRAEGYASGRLKGHYASKEAILRSMEKANAQTYGDTPGQLANMAVSSPPFGEGETRDRSPVQPGMVADCITRAYTQDRQGTTPGNLATMGVSSPPYENRLKQEGEFQEVGSPGYEGLKAMNDGYSKDPGNIGNQHGETFWTAARQIVEQLYTVLKPGGHAVWVVKAFVRDGKLVDFPGQWRALCESVGFVTLHEHHALLTEERGTQIALNGDHHTKKVEWKSFFRRLAENKGSPRIDFEVVLCMVRP